MVNLLSAAGGGAAAHAQTADLPLAVDLDGTLIRCDLFTEGLIQFAFSHPLKLFRLPLWLLKGRAYAKARIAEYIMPEAANLPYDERVTAWLAAQRAAGRTLALATACDARPAQRVADHLGLFDVVFASDGRTNLKSARKADALAAAFPNGFVYAGNEQADLAVWRRAKRAVVVNASAGLARRAAAKFDVEKNVPPMGGGARALIKAIRPQQWVKNLLVFLPLLLSQEWQAGEKWAAALGAFCALSLVASAGYLINDAADIEADRAHPRKRRRPFAAGAVSPFAGLALAAMLLAGGFLAAAHFGVAAIVLAYFVTTMAYNFYLKRLALADVFALAGLYTIRVILGGVATDTPASGWLLAFSCFFFLSLALVKRAQEGADLAVRGGGAIGRRGYSSDDVVILKAMGVASAFVASLVLALYLQNSLNLSHYREPMFLWGLPSVVIFWLCRVWLKTARGEMRDDPIVFAAGDWPSWLLAAIAAGCFAAAVTAPGWLLRLL